MSDHAQLVIVDSSSRFSMGILFQPARYLRRALTILMAGVMAILRTAAQEPGSSEPGWLLELNASALVAVRQQCLPAPLVARNLAVLHLAIEDAWLHAEKDRTWVALTAGEAVAESLFPGWLPPASGRAEVTRLAGPCQVEAVRAGQAIGKRWLVSREGDAANGFVNYEPKTGAGAWRRTYPQYRPPELPNWPLVAPFVIASARAFAFPGPPSLDSDAWKTALTEMKARGGKIAPSRSAEESEIAAFWSDFSYTCTPPGHWNLIAAEVVRRESLSTDAAVRLLAMLNTAMADAGIVCWETKYRFNFWRPVTALNPDADPEGWLPLLNTPPHPEYPSGHSMFSGAAAEVLAACVGHDRCDVTVPSDALPGVVRHFPSFSALASEISQSRVLGGIHFRFSCTDGLAVGRAVGREVLHARTACTPLRTTLVQK